MAIYVVKMVHAYVKLCCIQVDLNFGLTSIGTQCRITVINFDKAMQYL